jgi:DNA-binding transcriptional LysR family regulator
LCRGHKGTPEDRWYNRLKRVHSLLITRKVYPVEIRHLRYFVAIAEEGSFTRAAERLWVAQPGLSTQIRRLERELGVQLLERHTRGVELTEAGELFLERARAVLSAVAVAGATARDLEAGVAGTVRLGLASGASWRGTSALLERFARERSQVELTLLEGYGGTLWRDLRDGRLDALLAPAAFASADLHRLALGAEPWVVVVEKGHSLAGIGPLSASDLSGQQIAVTAHRDGAAQDRAIANLLDDLGVGATLVRAGPGPALHGAVSRGDALVLTTAPDALPPGVLARPLRPPRTLAFELLWRDETPAPALREFVRMAADLAARGRLARRAPAAVA